MINFSKQSGFSLIETFVAVSLLLIIIVGPMAISAKTAKSTSFASEQVQAYFLAQEGVELAQKARDDFRLAELNSLTPGDGSGWDNFIDTSVSGKYQSCFQPSGCGLSWDNSNQIQVISCSMVANCNIYKSNNNERSKLSHDSTNPNTKTAFTRIIKFSSTEIDREVKVESIVSWRTGSILASQEVNLDTYLFNTNYVGN